jgi:hypothetical protein
MRVLGDGVYAAENVHVRRDESDWTVSIDELQGLCPNLAWVTLVVAWFGDDLRAGSCTIRPKVDEATKATRGAEWDVAGLTRGTAGTVSQVEGRPAYGGSPSDASVVRAIADLKARGLKVVLAPFVLMDIPAGNALPDPEGGVGQPAYPWRGLITCDPAPGRRGRPTRAPRLRMRSTRSLERRRRGILGSRTRRSCIPGRQSGAIGEWRCIMPSLPRWPAGWTPS